jgi:hypothetical protein
LKIDAAAELVTMAPVRLTFEGWALPEIHPQSNLTTSSDIFLLWDHHYSFEAETWIKYYKGFVTFVLSLKFISDSLQSLLLLLLLLLLPYKIVM